MHPLNITPVDAENALAQLAAHVPRHVPIGRPLVATPNSDGAVQVVTDRAFWWSYADHAARVVSVHGKRIELVEYRNGAELSRRRTEMKPHRPQPHLGRA